MKEDLKKLMEENPEIPFVLIVYSEQELEELFDVLKEKNYLPIPPISLDELKNNAVEEYGIPVGFKVNQYNLSVSFGTLDHWKMFTKDILRYTDEGFEFIE